MLPIQPLLPEIAASLDAAPNLVLVAPPGAGKTTLVPPFLLDRPWARGGRLILVEPRRLAARAAARFMADALGERVGATVGLRMRMETRVSPATRIEIVTEGVLTGMILDDPSLDGIAGILFDEVHERSLDGDLGLALALDAQAGLREDLRLVAMSATLDGAAFARLMGGAPVIEGEGRAFSVETRHRPRAPGTRIEDAMTEAVLHALRAETGSILAFLPGAGEIARTAERLAERIDDPAVALTPLFGAMDMAAQAEAVAPAPPGRRKIVLATSIAETSLTIEGVRVVIDGGLARRPRHDPATGLTRLETVRVSRAAADQRTGRAGRTRPGVCYRLWAEPETRGLQPRDRPEMLDADLAGLALSLAEWGAADPASLAFLESPPSPAFAEARSLLASLDALDADGRITPHGRRLARIGLAPRLAHMLLASGPDIALAAELAALLTERGLGGRDPDLAARLHVFRGERSPRAVAARRLAESWARALPGEADAGSPSARASGQGGLDGKPVPGGDGAIGRLVALAFPERIAKARDGRPGAFVMVNGRGATVEAAHALARAPFLAVAELSGGGADARIVSAARLAAADLEEAFATRIEENVAVAYEAGARAVRARRERRLGTLLLASDPVPVPAGEGAAHLVGALAALGTAVLPWTAAQRQWRDRVGFLARTLGPPWPALDDTAILEALAPLLEDRTAFDQIGADDLSAALRAILPHDLARRLDREAPSHFEAPSGSRLPIDYRPEGPALAVRVQEMFGLARHPTVAGHPLLIELLSPAHRPVQVTRDLPGFWAGSYAAVRAEMRGRYPRHPWPDDPRTAPATTRAKPRPR